MATQTNVLLIDDLDGSAAEHTITFGLDGQAYEIDLSAPNADQRRGTLGRYVEHARRAANGKPNGKRGRKPGSTSRGGGGSTVPAATFRTANGDAPLTADERAALRAWAADQPGVTVAERGRIAASTIAEWRAATGGRTA